MEVAHVDFALHGEVVVFIRVSVGVAGFEAAVGERRLTASFPVMDVRLTLDCQLGILGTMSTLVQIESAVASLPAEDQWSLLTWLQGKLASTSRPQAEMPEALKAFRQLQAEVGLTAEAASAWKAAVADARH